MRAEKGVGDKFGDDEHFSDDDRSSSKVRRTAMRCLRAAASIELLPRAE